MGILRGIIGFILSVLLLAGAALTMSSFAVEEALSDEAIDKAIKDTDAINQITAQFMGQGNGDLGGGYSDIMRQVLCSDAVTEFMTDYIGDTMNAVVHGETAESIFQDELSQAIRDGVDECIDNGSISLGEYERTVFDELLAKAMPSITESMNYVLEQLDITSLLDDDTKMKIELLQRLVSPEIRYGSLAATLLICLFLIIMYQGRLAGVLSCMIPILLVAAFFWLMSVTIGETMSVSGDFVDLCEKILYTMASWGMKRVSLIGGAVGILFLPAWPLFRLIFR